MTTIVTRSFAENRGWNWPKNVSHTINGRAVTFEELLEERKRKQRRELNLKRQTSEPEIMPCFIWTFFCPGVSGIYYRGWYSYIRTTGGDYMINFHHFGKQAMELFPCGLLPIEENYNRWKVAFAEQYHRPTDKRPNKNGLAIGRVEILNNKIKSLYEY